MKLITRIYCRHDLPFFNRSVRLILEVFEIRGSPDLKKATQKKENQQKKKKNQQKWHVASFHSGVTYISSAGKDRNFLLQQEFFHSATLGAILDNHLHKPKHKSAKMLKRIFGQKIKMRSKRQNFSKSKRNAKERICILPPQVDSSQGC